MFDRTHTVPVGHFLLLIGLIFLPDQCNSVGILFSMSVKTVLCMHKGFQECIILDYVDCSQAAPQHMSNKLRRSLEMSLGRKQIDQKFVL